MSCLELKNNPNSAPAVDVMALMGRCLGNFKIVERVLSMFLVTGKSDLNQLQVAIESQDFEAIAEFSHRFRGASSNVSATKLCEIISSIEQQARSRNDEELPSLLTQLHSEWEDVERYLQDMLSGSGNSVSDLVMSLPNSPETSHAGTRC